MTNKDNVIIAITGKSSSGKDAVANALSSKGYKNVVSVTTRPMRSNDLDGVDYHFINNVEFQDLISNNKLVEHRYYDTIENGKQSRWYYGIERTAIDLDNSSYVCVVDLVGLEHIKKEYGERVMSFYIDVDDEKRKARAIARDRNFDLDEWERRLEDDEIKFKNVERKVDLIVKNDRFDKCVKDIIDGIEFNTKLRVFYTQYASY